MKKLKKKIKRMIERSKKQLNNYDFNSEKYTKHGYESIGYIKGKLSTLENILDDLKAIK